MTMEPLQVIAAAAMLGTAAALIFAFLGHLRASSERRLSAMLSRVGLDPGLAAGKRREAVTTALRQRCRGCACEDLCERWLRGDTKGANDFCPNSKVFRAMAVRRVDSTPLA